MQNKKKIKYRSSTKYLYFHEITGPTLFFPEEKIAKKKKKKKKKFLLSTDQFFFKLVETQLFFTPNHFGNFTYMKQ